jgi:hypothetical protein
VQLQVFVSLRNILAPGRCITKLVYPEVLETFPMAIGYIEQNFGYGRQDKATLWFLRLQDGMGGRQTAMVFTEMSEEAVIRWREEDRQPLQVL